LNFLLGKIGGTLLPQRNVLQRLIIGHVLPLPRWNALAGPNQRKCKSDEQVYTDLDREVGGC
jgi:hypothetical protein